MDLRLLPSAWGNIHQYLTTFVLNDCIAIDAGSLGFVGTPAQQTLIRHLFLTHSHLDHLASLPIFLENVYQSAPNPVTIHAGRAVLDALESDLFNGRLWAPFDVLTAPGVEFFRLNEVHAGEALDLEGLRITPIPVDHVVPTFGYLIEDAHAAILISSDTGPTTEFWQVANQTPNLQAVFLEVTFPNRLADLADVTKHLTPAMFRAETAKLTKQVRTIGVHLKARFTDELLAELKDIEIVEPGRTYTF